MDLTAFAPDYCGQSSANDGRGHDLRVGRGNRRVLSFPCECQGIRSDPRKRRHHIQVRCAACQAEGRDVCYFDPPHTVGSILRPSGSSDQQECHSI